MYKYNHINVNLGSYDQSTFPLHVCCFLYFIFKGNKWCKSFLHFSMTAFLPLFHEPLTCVVHS